MKRIVLCIAVCVLATAQVHAQQQRGFRGGGGHSYREQHFAERRGNYRQFESRGEQQDRWFRHNNQGGWQQRFDNRMYRRDRDDRWSRDDRWRRDDRGYRSDRHEFRSGGWHGRTFGRNGSSAG